MSLPSSSPVSPAARAAADDRSRRQQAVDHRGVGVGSVVGHFHQPPRRRGADPVECLLDRHGDSVKRAPDVSGHDGIVGGAGSLPRLVEPAHDDRVDVSVESLDSLDVVLEQL
jgi:hypothetical protein